MRRCGRRGAAAGEAPLEGEGNEEGREGRGEEKEGEGGGEEGKNRRRGGGEK